MPADGDTDVVLFVIGNIGSVRRVDNPLIPSRLSVDGNANTNNRIVNTV